MLHIEVFDKTHENVNCFVTRLLKEFSNKQGNKRNLDDFL